MSEWSRVLQACGLLQDGFHFESGPSLYSGMASTGRSANPLAHVLQAIDEVRRAAAFRAAHSNALQGVVCHPGACPGQRCCAACVMLP